MIPPSVRPWVGVILACYLFAIAACSNRPDYQEVEIYPTSGSVSVDGEPAYGAVIVFHPQGDIGMSKGNRVFAKVKEDGTFAMTTYVTEDGAPAGKYVATVVWPQDPNARGPSPDRLRGKYAKPDQSDLTVTVEKRENTLPAWEL